MIPNICSVSEDTIFTICDICEYEIEVPGEGMQECPKCHHYTCVEDEEFKNIERMDEEL